MTSALRKRAAVLGVLFAVAAATGAAGPATGQGGGGDTSAVAINTHDGSSIFKFAFQVRRVTGDVVDTGNAAVAYASCTDCQTVAISIQVLLVAGSPSVFSPENVAIAINEQCTLCDTMALAYQFAVGMQTRLKFTAEGNRQLADLRQRLQQLRESGLSIEEIQAQASQIVDELAAVLASELVGVTEPGGEGTASQDAPADPPASTGSSPEPSPDAPAETTPSTETAPPSETAPAEQPPPATTAP